VVHHIAHYPIRMRGTFCGSLAHADPASEWCLVAATLGAEVHVRSTGGSRVIAVDDLLLGLMSTSLKDGELLVEARLPILPADTKFGFYEFSRRAGDYALGMALVTFRIENGVMVEPRVGVGSAEAKARRIPEAEATLVGKPPVIEHFRAAGEAAAAAIVDPLEDIQADAAYRLDLVKVVTRRALERAIA